MSKRGYISRYLLIIKKLKAKPYATYKELDSHMQNQFEYLRLQDETLNIGVSQKTFQRDVKEIRNIFGIDIEYSRSNKGYFINEGESDNMNFERMMEAFDIFNSLNLAQDLSQFIYLEKSKPQGTENLYGIIHAIKNKFKIKFCYEKFWGEELSNRTADPYALKEFKNRWYILAHDTKDGNIKSFALDRLSNLEITNCPFYVAKLYDVEESFKYSFGVINPLDQEPQDIILSFDPFQGKYIKTLPIHNSQQILIDSDKELQIKLKLKITHDLVMELLSFGSDMRVLQPKSLIEEIKNTHQKAYNKYQ